MTRTIDEANRAITGVREMPFGLARNEVAAELAREIGTQGPESAHAFALFTLVESYAFSEEVEKAYLPFTRSVRLWDERPELFDTQDVHSLFWSFKWMVSHLMGYPSIPAAYREIIPALWRQRKDPDWHITPKLPEGISPVTAAAQ